MRRLLLIDDRQLLRELLATHLAATGDFVLDHVGTAAEGWERFQAAPPDLVVCELDLPDESGLDLLAHCREQHPALRFAFLTECWSDALLEQALRLGTGGYLLKQDDLPTTRENLRRCADGQCAVSESLLPRLFFDEQAGRYRLREPHSLHGLNPRQLQILRYLVRGLRVQDIAQRTGQSASAVESHKFRLMRQLGITDRVELTRFALREGLTTI